MRESEHPDMFPMQERNAVDSYALRVARNSTLSDIAAVGAADALSGTSSDEEGSDVPEGRSAPAAGARPGSGEEHHAHEDEGGQQHDGHPRDLPGATGA